MDAGKKKIWVRGQFVEVTDEVYTAYMRGDRKMRYFEADLKSERPVYGSNGEIKQVLPSREDSLCLLYTSPSPRDRQKSRMPSSA